MSRRPVPSARPSRARPRRWLLLPLLAAFAVCAGRVAEAAPPRGYLVWSKGTADDPASRKIHRLTLPDRTEPRVLTTGEDIEPQVSPDGRWVAYAKAKFPGGSDYHDFKLWRIFVVSIHGVGEGRREIKIDDDGAWPSWGKGGALYYNQADGTHTRLVRVELDERGRVARRQVVAATKELFAAYGEVNEITAARDESWFAARTRGNAVQNGVSALTLSPARAVLVARAGAIGCMPRVSPDGAFSIIAGATEGIRWGHGPSAPSRREDQLLVPPLSADHKAYHPGISSDARWVLAAQGTDPDHNAGRYDLHLYPLDPATMSVGEALPLTVGGFNGWPDLWVGEPGPPPPPRPEVADFYPSSYTVAPGEAVTLTWSTFGAEEILLDGRKVAPEGEETQTPAASASYVLRARSAASPAAAGEEDSRTVAIAVNAVPQPVVVRRFAAAAPKVPRGTSTTLSWEVANATTLDLDGQRAAPVGSREVTPLETTTYALTARGHDGPVTARVTVVVEALGSGLLPDRGGFRCAAARPGGLARGAGPTGLLVVALGLTLVLTWRRRR